MARPAATTKLTIWRLFARITQVLASSSVVLVRAPILVVSIVAVALGTGCSCTCGVPVCGDELREEPEACDGADLGGASCSSLGYATGSLGCAGDCTLDLAGCELCGDDVASGLEPCDGDDLRGQTCAALGYVGGSLACATDCQLDDVSCNYCGDEIVAPGEECDGTELGGEDCLSLGFPGGTLACGFSCAYDTSGCDPKNPSALLFDGTDDFLELPAPPLSSFTVELWVKPEPGAPAGWVIGRWDGMPSAGSPEQLMAIATGVVSPAGGASVDFWVPTGGGWLGCPVAAGRWYHVAVGYEVLPEGAGARIPRYINGGACPATPDECCAGSGCCSWCPPDCMALGCCECQEGLPSSCGWLGESPFWWDRSTAVQPFRMGWPGPIPWGGGNQPYTGLVDEVRIWDHRRTEEEIRAAMLVRLAGNEPGLVAYWRFDEGSGQVLIDSSPSAGSAVLGTGSGPDRGDPVFVTDTPF